MPKYAKFMKDVLSKKKRYGDYEMVALTEECSATLQKKLPPKLKDPGSFSIPCHLGNNKVTKALCDLGASINLMPLSMFRKLNGGGATNYHIFAFGRSIICSSLRHCGGRLGQGRQVYLPGGLCDI